jgi:hypothetical protein
MKLFLWCVTGVALSAAAGGAKIPADLHDASQGSQCGPPEYCARTDRRVELYPEKPTAPVKSVGNLDPKVRRHGFQLLEENGDSSVWTLDLHHHTIATPKWIQLKTNQGEHN